jgi:hypothetical protein
MASNGQLNANRHRVYNARELEKIDSYKERYLKIPTPIERKDFAQDVIFPEVFNYWIELGMVFSAAEETKKKKVCGKFNSESSLTSL